MELDKRIKDRTGIQTCILFDKKYIGKKGFFFDEFCQLIDLKAKCCYGTLIDINETDVANDLCFKATSDKTGYNCFFRFFIPEDSLLPEVKPEKKYRPFSLEEFLNIFHVGDLIHFRRKNDDEVKVAMFTGYITDVDRIDDKTPGAVELMLGIFHYSLFSLFDEGFEVFFENKWQPFGTEVKENEE